MNEQNAEVEQRVFDMAKKDVLFLKQCELVRHDDRPDFVLKDRCGLKIGLEHFTADVYRVQDKNSSHISAGHNVLAKLNHEIYQKYHSVDKWNNEDINNASIDLSKGIKASLVMQSGYEYDAFLDNLHVGIHGKPLKVKGHIQKSKNYPNRKSYDLMGFLIGVPVPAFQYYFETVDSRQMSCDVSSNPLLYLLRLASHGVNAKPRRYHKHAQRIKGLPITNEIWKELDIFNDIDFVIIETYNANCLQEHYGQYFDKNEPKPHIYPAFSFGLTDSICTDVWAEHEDDNAVFNTQLKKKM